MKRSIDRCRRFPRYLVVTTLLLFLLASLGAGQVTETDCQKATLLYLEAQALREFFLPYATGEKKFDGPALKAEENQFGTSLQGAAANHLTECREGKIDGRANGTCNDYSRVRNAVFGGNAPISPPSTGMGTNLQSCKIYYGRANADDPKVEVKLDDMPEGGIELAEWLSMHSHERVHKSKCEEMNKGKIYDESVSLPLEPTSGDAALLSPYYLAMRDPQIHAAEEIEAYGKTMFYLHDFLKRSCFDPTLKISSDVLKGKCGSQQSPNGNVRLEHIPAVDVEKRYIVRTSAPPSVLEVDNTLSINPQIAVLPDGQATQSVSSRCRECCRPNTKRPPVYALGGIDNTIMKASSEVTVECEPAEGTCGSAHGEPHICTHDRLNYDFQGVGEFVLSKSRDFEVQARFKSFGDLRLVSVNAAIAAKFGDDRVALYAGDPVRMTINGTIVPIESGGSFQMPGGLFIRRDQTWYRFSKGGFAVEASSGKDRLGAVFVRVPRDAQVSGLLGNRDSKQDNDISLPDGQPFKWPVNFEDLYGKFGKAWRVTAKTSLFDYAKGESPTTFADLKYPEKASSIRNVNVDARAKAEAACKKAGVTNAINLENCIFDVAMTGDESFAEDAAVAPEPLARLETTGGGAAADVARRSAADGVTLEIPSVLIASYPVDVKITGPVQRGYQLRTVRAGEGPNARATNPASVVNLRGGETSAALHAPYPPGDYELLYVSPGRRSTLLSVPFRVVAPEAEIFAPDTAEANTTIEVRVVGDISPHTKIMIVPVGSPDSVVGDHSFLRGGEEQKGGTDETVKVVLRKAKPGRYEIQYVTETSHVVYARRPLIIK